MRSPFEDAGSPASLARGICSRRQPATATRSTARLGSETNGRPRANVTVTGGSCSTHVPPIVSVVHPSTGQTDNMGPYDRSDSTSASPSVLACLTAATSGRMMTHAVPACLIFKRQAVTQAHGTGSSWTS